MFKKLISGSIFKNVFTLISGTIVAQVVMLLIQLITRRLYGEEDFGAFGVYLAALGILVVVFSLKYELALVLPEKEEEASNLLFGLFIISLFFCVISYIVLFIFFDSVVKLLDFPEAYKNWLYFLPLSTLLFALYQSLNYYLVRRKQYKAIAVNKVSRRTFEGITQTVVGYAGKKTGLFIGDIIGNIANIISAIIQINIKNLNLSQVSFKETKRLLKKYYSFPVYQVLPGLLNTVSLLLPVFLINSFFGGKTVSYFDFSRQILSIPLALVSLSVSQVLLKDIAERRQNKQYIFKSIFKIAGYLLLIIFPVILVIYFWAPWIFSLIFTDKWESAGVISQIIIFSFAIQFIVSPLSSVLTALEKLKAVAVWQIFYFILIIGLFFFRDMEINDFLWLFTIINLFSYTVYFILILYFARKYDQNLFKSKSDTSK